MEYVGGTSLKEILKERMRANGGRATTRSRSTRRSPTCVEILPAFQYLHDLGLLYCDFKPDNVIQVGDAVKLIDLGGVRRIDDLDSRDLRHGRLPGPGGRPRSGPSVPPTSSPIGRTLAVLAMEFRGYQTHVPSTRSRRSTTRRCSSQHDSLYRLLLKACAPDPDDRFQSADELRVQLLGVLREVVAAGREGGRRALRRRRCCSTPDGLGRLPRLAATCPACAPTPATRMTPWLRDRERRRRRAAAGRARGRAGDQPEVLLARAHAALDGRSARPASTTRSRALLSDDPWEWRAVWMSGLAALARGTTAAARAAFNAVYGQVPGELAPKLALALACETSGETDVAEALYVVCARTDANYIAPAAFGLARIRSGRGDVDGAVRALDLVPATSRAYVQARRRRAACSRRRAAGCRPGRGDRQHRERHHRPGRPLPLPGRACSTPRSELVEAHGADTTVHISGHPAAEPALRDGLEAAYRDLAGHATTPRSGCASSTGPTRCAAGRCDDAGGSGGCRERRGCGGRGDACCGGALPVVPQPGGGR